MSREIEEKLLKEVVEKQDLVVALSKEKRNLTHSLQKKLKEIKREKTKLYEEVQNNTNSHTLPELNTSLDTQISQCGTNRETSSVQESDVAPSDNTGLQELLDVSWESSAKKSCNQGTTQVQSQELGNRRERPSSVCLEQQNYARQRTIPKKTDQNVGTNPRIKLLQRDKELYEYQSKYMMDQIMSLTVQLDEAKQRANECIILILNFS